MIFSKNKLSVLQTATALFIIIFGLLMIDMLNLHGFGRHWSMAIRLSIYIQPPIHALLITTLICSLGRLAHFSAICIAGWLLFFEMADLFARFFLQLHISPDMFFIIHGSSPQELNTFLHYLGPKAIVTVILWLLLFSFGIIFTKQFSFQRNSRHKRVCLATVSTGCLLFMWLGPLSEFTLLYSGVPVGTCRNIRTLYDQLKISESPTITSTFKIQTDNPPIGIIVIGESATRNHWSLYGYSRETTPNMSCLHKTGNIYVFSDLLASREGTQPAIRNLFTLATVENPNDGKMTLPWALAQAGCRTKLISAQSNWDSCGASLIALVFSSCHEKIYLNDLIKKQYYDEALLPYVYDHLAHLSGCRGSILFVHMNGSHFSWDKDCPPNKKKFAESLVDKETEKLNELARTYVNQYDNSIHYTDSILAKLIDKLQGLHRPTFLLYVSDHGETPNRGAMRVFEDNNLWEIPMIVWLSPEYKRAFPETVRQLNKAQSLPLQSDQLFYGMLELAQVREDPSQDMQAGSFLSPTFKVKPKRMICAGKQVYTRNPHDSEND